MIKTTKVTFDARKFGCPIIEWDETTQRIAEDLSDEASDRLEDMARLSIGAPMQSFHQSRRFERRMARARSELERTELATLKMLLETFAV